MLSLNITIKWVRPDPVAPAPTFDNRPGLYTISPRYRKSDRHIRDAVNKGLMWDSHLPRATLFANVMIGRCNWRIFVITKPWIVLLHKRPRVVHKDQTVDGYNSRVFYRQTLCRNIHTCICIAADTVRVRVGIGDVYPYFPGYSGDPL